MCFPTVGVVTQTRCGFAGALLIHTWCRCIQWKPSPYWRKICRVCSFPSDWNKWLCLEKSREEEAALWMQHLVSLNIDPRSHGRRLWLWGGILDKTLAFSRVFLHIFSFHADRSSEVWKVKRNFYEHLRSFFPHLTLVKVYRLFGVLGLTKVFFMG